MGGGIDMGETRLDTYLTIYLLQLPIFLGARFPLWCVYSCATCCCDDGEAININYESMRERIVSYDYVPYHLERLQNFEFVPVGREEIEFNRTLQHVRNISRA